MLGWFSLITLLFEFLGKILSFVFGLITTPVDTLLNTIFGPEAISTINTHLENFMNIVGDGVAFGVTLLPASFIQILSFIFSIWVIYLGVQWGYYLLMLIFRWVREVKFW